MIGGLILTGIALKVAADACIGGADDTVVRRGSTWFRGKYKKASGQLII